MRRSHWLAAGFVIFGVSAGCAHTTMPSLDHPRSADVQQKRALRYDPYADPSLGNDVSTVRPREYQNPPAEAEQSRWRLDPATNATKWGTQGRE